MLLVRFFSMTDMLPYYSILVPIEASCPLRSAQTLIIFVQSDCQKAPKNTRQCIKMMKISQMSVLCVSDAKISKTGEKRIKFA